jgi:hypothetical protein
VAVFYADENFPLQTVEALRRLGHDVQTAFGAGPGQETFSKDSWTALGTSSDTNQAAG